MSRIYIQEHNTKPSNFNFYDYEPKWHGMSYVIDGNWRDSYASDIDASVKSLSIGSIDESIDLSFLSIHFYEVEQIFIECQTVTNFDVIQNLPHLQSLSLICFKSFNLELTFPPSLKNLTIEWKSKFKFIQYPSRLERLTIIKGAKINWPELFGSNSNLVKLELEKCDIKDIQSITVLPKLRFLYVQECKNLSFSLPKIANTALKYLYFYKVPTAHLDFLKGFSRLEVVILESCGKVDSISPISELVHLKGLMLSGNTIIEGGDFDFLKDLKDLRNCFIAPKKHYSLKTKEPWNWKNFGQVKKDLFK